jgi:hypothetical protein
MASQFQGEAGHFRELRQAYDAAFAKWATQWKRLQRLTEAGAGEDQLAGLRQQVEAARNEYEVYRNQLVDFMLLSARKHARSVSRPFNATEPARRQHVEHFAYRLWEQAGRPSGTAESDWLRAESLLNAATVLVSSQVRAGANGEAVGSNIQ